MSRSGGPRDSEAAAEAAAQLRANVQRAIAEKSKGPSKTYQSLVDQLVHTERHARNDADAVNHLVALLEATTSCCTSISPRSHERLLSVVLGIPLWSCQAAARSAVLSLVANLVSSSGQCVAICLEMLVGSILPPTQGNATQADNMAGPWSLETHAVEVQRDIVQSLERVLALVPTSPPTIVRLLVSNMPHKLRDRNAHALYLSAIFALCEGEAGAAVRSELLGAVVDHLVTIDVEIKWEDIVDSPGGQEAAEEEGSDSDGDDGDDIFELEGMSALEIAQRSAEGNGGHHYGEGPHNSGGDAAAGSAAGGAGWDVKAPSSKDCINRSWGADGQPPTIDVAAEKLDTLMELTLGHLKRRCDAGQVKDVWETMRDAFLRTILHTHRSKFTQYLIFYLCSKSPEFCSQSLVQTLLAMLDDRRSAPITRSACAAYLASFLARGKFVSDSVVVGALQAMVNWAARYTQEHENKSKQQMRRQASSGGIQTEQRAPMVSSQGAETPHQVYYAVIQAVLYILCYHLEPLLRSEKSEPKLVMTVQAIVSQGLPPLLTHSLEPLPKCLPSVTEEFTRQTFNLGLQDCSTCVSKAAAQPVGTSRPLAMFFPFDPYLLLRSRTFLELPQTYVQWRSGHPSGALHDDDDDDTDSNASNIGSDIDDKEDVDGDSNGDDDDDDDDDDEDDEERRTRFGSMASASPALGVSMGASPEMGLSYWANRRTKSGLDTFGLPVGVAHQQVSAMKRPPHIFPHTPDSDDGLISPAGTSPSPYGQSPMWGAMPGSSPSPMSLGCTPNNPSHMQRMYR